MKKKRWSTIKYQCKMTLIFLHEALMFFVLLLKHNASSYTDKRKKKMEYTLLRENHVIEKGMSISNPRKGFGQSKVKKLIDRLDKYVSLFGMNDFLNYPLSTIKNYIHYTKNNSVEIDEIEMSYQKLISKINNYELNIESGVKLINKKEICNTTNFNFAEFAKSRHSIRMFSDETPSKEKIIKALEIAQLTPSACNRQAWHTYVFEGEKCTELINQQGGANGFEDEIQTAILITADMNAFLYYEPYQAYIDGGMYSMSLIYALHSLNLATIPLSTGFSFNKTRKIKEKFNISPNEVLIVIIGVGEMLDNFNVAISTRNSIEKTNKWI